MDFLLPTNIFIVYIMYIFRTYIKILFIKKERVDHKDKQKKLEVLRDIKYKTDKQQLEFINLKYPKKDPFKWTFKNVGEKVLYIISYVGVIMFVRYLWGIFICKNISWLMLISIMVFLPLVLNSILKKFNLHQDDIRVYFRKIPKQQEVKNK